MTRRRLQIGVQGASYPPMHDAIEGFARIEAQGWDYVNFPDQLPPPWPVGLLPDRITPDLDRRSVISAISPIFFGSLQLQSAAAVVTNRIGVHVAVIDALRRNPALFAQELVTISHLSKGRAVWAIGTGEVKQFEPYGESRHKPLQRTEEALRIMRALWESGGQPVTRDSESWPLKDALFPIPLYNATPPRLLMVGGGPKVYELTGELGDGWLTFLPGGVEDDVAELARVITEMKQSAARHGRDPEALDFNAKIHLVLAENDEVAWNLARRPPLAYSAMTGSMMAGTTWKKWGFEHPLGFDEKYNWGNSSSLDLQTMPAAEFVRTAHLVPDEVTDHFFVWGGPQRVAERLRGFIDAGLTHISFNNFVPWTDTAQGLTWARHASEVLELLGHEPLTLEV